MNREKISYELFRFMKGEMISHEVENEHLGPMGASYKITYKFSEDFVVYEIGAMGGCDYYIEAIK